MAALYFAQECPRPTIEHRCFTTESRRSRLVFNGIGRTLGPGLVKIGLASNLLTHRLQCVGSQVERSMVLLGVIDDASYTTESAVHQRFRAAHVMPGRPWGREWFGPTRELADFIAGLSVPSWVRQLSFAHAPMVHLATG